MEKENEEIIDFNLWLTVKLQEQIYAIDCRYVDSIFEVVQNIVPLPKADERLLGLINLRGSMLPIMDLRKLFRMKTVQDEMAEFKKMISLRKDEHIEWVDTLKHCVVTEEEFTLTTDPHCCKFGKWYDHYKPTNQVVKHYFSQINEPHTKLHQSALHCFAANYRSEKQKIFTEETDKAMSQVVQALDNAVVAYQKSFRKMCVAVSNGVSQIGLLVDEIISTEQINNIQKLALNSEKSGIYAVAQDTNDNNVLLVDTEYIISAIEYSL